MIRKQVRFCVGVLCLSFLCMPLAMRGQLSKEDRQSAQKMIAGTLYLRIQVPCKFGVGAWAPYVESLLEVSPTEFGAERKLAVPLKKHENIYWGFFPNTPVRYGKLNFEGSSVNLWMEGVSPNIEFSLDFINIKTLDEFSKAFILAFSRVPLQEEHPQWPLEIRKAIAERHVVAGMTKAQAYIVVGTPLNITTGQENGAQVETWVPRQDTGDAKWVRARKTNNARTGFPVGIKFIDGKLTSIQ